MRHRTGCRLLAVLFVAAVLVVVALPAARLPYLPLVHGTTAGEVERLADWLGVAPGTRIADLGAGDGTYSIALARRVGASGRVYATEIDEGLRAEIRRAAAEAGLANVIVLEAAVSQTNLPEGCCDALFSRNVYHHLTRPAAINADLFRVLRPGARLLVIDFEPGGIMNLFGHGGEADRGHGTPRDVLIEEVTAAGFKQVRGPEAWRGRMYAVLFVRP